MIGGPARGGQPWDRIAGIARQILVEQLVIEGQREGGPRPHPYVPDTADFAAGLRLQVEWELICARIDECIANGGDNGRLAILNARKMAIRNLMNMP